MITQNIDPEHWACLREGKRKQTRTQPQTGEQRGPVHWGVGKIRAAEAAPTNF